MAIIYSYPVVQPTTDDLVLGTDATDASKPTKNFTVQSIIDLVTVSGNDLQAVLNNGNVATGKDINLTNNNFRGGSFITTGNATITGTTGSGFTQITADDFTGDLTGIVKAGSSIESTVTGVTQSQGDNSTKLATTAYVDGKVDPSVLQYLGDSTGPFDLNLINDDFKIAGTANEIETTATTVAGNVGTVTLSFPTAGVTLPDGSIATTQALTDNSTKVATTAFVHGKNDAQTLNFSNGANASTVLLNSQTFVVSGTTNQIATTTTPQTITIGLTTDVTIAGTYTGATFSGDLNGTVNTATTGTTQSAGDNSTKIATTAYVDNAAGAKILQYKDSTSTVHDLNLSDDDLQFNGDSNITVTAAAVSSNVGIVTVDLNNDVTISGTMQAGTLSDGTFSGTAGTYTGGVSITSADFVGALTGNADTATALASSGNLSLSGDVTSSLSGTDYPYTYTSGGALNVLTNIADSVIMGKVLDGYSAGTAGAIGASDTVLEAFEKLQASITATTGLAYEGTWDPGNSATSGGTPDLRQASAKVNGHFYICSADGVGTPNGDGTTPNSWKTGDWVIYVANGSATDEWQKLDQSNEVLGSGTANKIAKWTGTNTLGTGLINDDGTDVTIGNSGNLIVQGNTTLGDASSDTTTIVGPGTFNVNAVFKQGIGLGATPDYGTAGQVLTSGGGSATANTWTTPTTGTVTSIGLTETGDALTITGSPVTGSGTINIAGAGTASQYINGELDLVTFPTLDNYQYWTLAGDSGTPQNITSTNTATIAGGTGINTLIPGSSTDTINVNIDYIGADNAILSAPAGTPVATDELWFNNADVSSGSIQRATIADIVDLGNETLAQVLSNGNTTGGTDIAVSANDDITFTDTSKAIFGDSSDLQIYHDGSNSYINETGAGVLSIQSDGTEVQINKGSSEYMGRFITDAGVKLYYDNSLRFETVDNGISIDSAYSYSRISLKGSGTTYGTLVGDSTNGLWLRSGGSSNQGIGINGYNTTFFGSWGGGVAGTVMKVEGFTPKVEIGDSTNFGNGNLTDLEVWGDVDVKGSITSGSSGVSSVTGRKFAYVTKALTTAGGWTDMFSISGVFIGVISEVFAQCNLYGSITRSEALSYHVAQAGGTSGSAANTPVYNKIIDTGPGSAGSFELQFLAYNASNNNHGYKCQARVLTANSTVDISVNWMDSSVNSHTFTDLT